MDATPDAQLEMLWTVVTDRFPELSGSPVTLLAAGWDSLRHGRDGSRGCEADRALAAARDDSRLPATQQHVADWVAALQDAG